MGTVKSITRFKYDGVEYDDLKKIKEHIENEIGSSIIDQIDSASLTTKNKLRLLNVLTDKDNRKLLIRLLSVTYKDENFDGSLEINVLDL